MTDLIFLKALRDKLKGSNIKSIHLNALPGRYATRLDFANLNYIRPDFAEKFLNQLLRNRYLFCSLNETIYGYNGGVTRNNTGSTH